MTADDPIPGLLSAPLSPGWTIEGLAEQLLDTIAAQTASEEQEFILDAATLTDAQSKRLLRPLLACLASKEAVETGTSSNLYGGRLTFQRPGPAGLVWILAMFDNRPGTVRAVFRCCRSSPPNGRAGAESPPTLADAGFPLPALPQAPSKPRE